MLYRHALYLFLALSFLPTSYNESSSDQNGSDDKSIRTRNNNKVTDEKNGGDGGGCLLADGDVFVEDCDKDLLTGQYLCTELDIDPETQQLAGCSKEGRGKQKCTAIPGIVCQPYCNSTFLKEVDCLWTNGYSFDTALILSIFMGMFGADRFYLGYPAIGTIKFATLGFFFIGHLVDVILIATQTLGPADNSSYVISYFGPVLNKVSIGENTYRKERFDWYEYNNALH